MKGKGLNYPARTHLTEAENAKLMAAVAAEVEGEMTVARYLRRALHYYWAAQCRPLKRPK